MWDQVRQEPKQRGRDLPLPSPPLEEAQRITWSAEKYSPASMSRVFLWVPPLGWTWTANLTKDASQPDAWVPAFLADPTVHQKQIQHAFYSHVFKRTQILCISKLVLISK